MSWWKLLILGVSPSPIALADSKAGFFSDFCPCRLLIESMRECELLRREPGGSLAAQAAASRPGSRRFPDGEMVAGTISSGRGRARFA